MDLLLWLVLSGGRQMVAAVVGDSGPPPGPPSGCVLLQDNTDLLLEDLAGCLEIE